MRDDWQALKRERYGMGGDRPADGDSEMVNILIAAAIRRMKGHGKEVRLQRIERKLNFLIMAFLGAFGGKVEISPAAARTAMGMVKEIMDLLDDGELDEGNDGAV